MLNCREIFIDCDDRNNSVNDDGDDDGGDDDDDDGGRGYELFLLNFVFKTLFKSLQNFCQIFMKRFCWYSTIIFKRSGCLVF